MGLRLQRECPSRASEKVPLHQERDRDTFERSTGISAKDIAPPEAMQYWEGWRSTGTFVRTRAPSEARSKYKTARPIRDDQT